MKIPSSHPLLLCALGLLAIAAPLQAQVQPHFFGTSPKDSLPRLQIPDALGVNIHFTDAQPGELDMLKDGGFRVARMDFSWGGTEKAKGIYDFSAYDRLLAGLKEHGIQPLFILDYSNSLYDEGLSPNSDEGRNAFAKWAAAAAVHFKGNRILWEMYNEPNGFWKPKPDTDAYIKLALATGKALRVAAPNECYIGPGVSGMDFPFLEACFKAGLLDYWQAVSVHPYRQSDPESVSNEYRRLRVLIEIYGPKNRIVPILSGEWGYSSAWRDFEDSRQGKYLPRQWMTNLMNEVPVSIWYDWHDDGTDPKDAEHHFGTTYNTYHAGRNPVYDPKPSYIAARTLSKTFDGFEFSKRLMLDSPNDYLLLFSKNTQPKLAVWTITAAHEITIPASAGSFKITNYLGEAQPDGVATADGLKLRISDSPLYLEPTQPNEVLGKATLWGRMPLDYFVAVPNVIDTENGPIRMKRDSAPLERREQLRVGNFTLTQSDSIVVINPLQISVEPTQGDMVKVHVLNLYGFPTDGQISINGGAAQPVNFARRETEKTFTFPMARHNAVTPWQATIHFQGVNDDDVLDSNYRFVPLTSFAALTPENLSKTLVVHPDGDPNVPSQETLSISQTAPEPAPDGGPVLELTYNFSPGWKFANVQPVNGTFASIDGQPKMLGMWVYGDNSGNLLRMRFSDSSGQTFQPGGTALNWKGWRYYSFPIDASSAHWGGANDGKIHGDLKVETLFLLDSASQKGGEGEIYISSPSWIY